MHHHPVLSAALKTLPCGPQLFSDRIAEVSGPLTLLLEAHGVIAVFVGGGSLFACLCVSLCCSVRVQSGCVCSVDAAAGSAGFDPSSPCPENTLTVRCISLIRICPFRCLPGAIVVGKSNTPEKGAGA